MKILFCTRTAPENSGLYLALAMQEHGHDVQILSSPGADRIIQHCMRRPPDVVFCTEMAGTYNHMLTHCRKNGILTVAWITRLLFGERHVRPDILRSDVVFSTDAGHHQTFRGYTDHFEVLREGIHEPHYYECPRDYKYQVGYIGDPNEHTRALKTCQVLQERYKHDFKLAADVRGRPLNNLLAQIKVVVCDSIPAREYHSGLIYEIIGRGGFLLHPKNTSLERQFVDKVHFGSYNPNNRKEIIAAVQHWLHHEGKREQVRQTGFEACVSQLYYDRAQQALATIEKVKNDIHSPRVCN